MHPPRRRTVRRAALCAGVTLSLFAPLRAGAGAAELQAPLRVCAQPTSGCDFTSLAEAARAVGDDGVIVMAAGIYREGAILTADRLTLRGEPGARLQGALVADRAALVVRGADARIEGIECANITGPFRNGACIFAEGRNITVRDVYFHDSEEGLIAADAAGTVIIEDSLFEHLGGADGHAHAIYINQSDALELRRSRIMSSKGTGHEVKSRASRTLIEDTVIAGLGGEDSRQVDISNGGVATIRNSILEKGPHSTESDVIGYGLEGLIWPANSLTVENCIIIVDRERGRVLRSTAAVALRDNLIVGVRELGVLTRFANWFGHLIQPSRFGDSVVEGTGGRWLADRQAAHLAAFPFIPRPAGAQATGGAAVQPSPLQ